MGTALPEQWNPSDEPAPVGAGAVTLVEGSSFCVCSPGGDIGGTGPCGIFFRDTRILSRWDLRVDGELPDPLAAMTPDPYRAIFLGRLSRRFGRTDTNLLVRRERRIGNGLREDLVLHNPGAEPTTCTIMISVSADFADLFEVKEGRVQRRGEARVQAQDDRLYLDLHWRGTHRGAVVEAPAVHRSTHGVIVDDVDVGHGRVAGDDMSDLDDCTAARRCSVEGAGRLFGPGRCRHYGFAYPASRTGGVVAPWAGLGARPTTNVGQAIRWMSREVVTPSRE